MEKKTLSERDICTKFITPAIERAGWHQHQFREEVKLTDGRVIVRGKLAARVKNPNAKGGPKRADYVLYAKPNLPIAIIEAKKNTLSIAHGMQQALAYAEMLDAPFAVSSNGDGFLVHDRTGLTQPVEKEYSLEELPGPDVLWPLYQQCKGITEPKAQAIIEQPYYSDGSGRAPRYYQRVAVNRAIEAIVKGQDRVLLVAEQGIPLDVLQQTVPNGSELDAFDLVAHVAFNQPPLTRKERASNVKKRNVFGKYGDQARSVLEALLDKFADHGVQDIESPKVLELPPFDKLGSKTQIRRGIFGSTKNYQQALSELKTALYSNDVG